MIFTPLNETKLKRKGERTSRYEATTKWSCDSVGEHDGSDGHDDDDDGDWNGENDVDGDGDSI